MDAVTFLLDVWTALLGIPCVVLFSEVIAASLLPQQDDGGVGERRARIAVIVPAHNESIGLQPTLDDLKSQLRSGDRLLVVADNCTDDTASVATKAGVEVAVRSDPAKIGKGYALDWGLNQLAAEPPDVVIMVDADCRVCPGTMDRLASVCSKTNRPVQALYLMTAPFGSSINHQVAEFAWRLKNWVRPLGLSSLGLPCQLMGSGMAFPWKVIREARLPGDSIVEDLKLGLDLARAGTAPVFCPSAIVRSTFPKSAAGAHVQRQRWEQGHIALILTLDPRLLLRALQRRDARLLALVLDLCVPPLTVLGGMLTISLVLTGLAVAAGHSSFAAKLTFCCMMLVFASILLSWLRHGRDILPGSSFALVGSYLAGKLHLYKVLLAGDKISRWIRADRS